MPNPSSLRLVERHRYFVPGGGRPGALTRGGESGSGVGGAGSARRRGDPWRLAPVEATVRTNTLFDAAGLETPEEPPTLEYSPGYESRVVGVDVVPR